jgi:hypothetical protein
MSKVVTAVVVMVGALVAGERLFVSFVSSNRIAQAQDTKSDVKQIIQHSMEPNGASKTDPKTEAGKDLKSVMARIQQREDEFLKEFDGYAVPDAFEWEHLATPKGRAATLKGLDGELAACRKVYIDTSKLREELKVIVKKYSGVRESGKVDEMNAEDGKLERARTDLYSKYKKYIQAIADSKLIKQGGETFFVHEVDRKKCDVLLNDMVKAEGKFEADRKALLESRLAARDAALTRLGS